MKKLFVALLLISACILSVAGCDNKQDKPNSENPSETQTEIDTETNGASTTETEKETSSKRDDITAECVVKKGNRYVIVLPTSKASIPVDSAYEKYLSRVSDELILAAEAKITEQVNALGDEPQWTIGSYDGEEMCLVVEVIKFVEGADYLEEGGCGIDHEHIFFAESIITEQ